MMNDHTLPLVDIIPFSPEKASNLLILDSWTTEADFVVTSLVREILLQQQQPSSATTSSSSVFVRKTSPTPAAPAASSTRSAFERRQVTPSSSQIQSQNQQQRRVFYISGAPTTTEHIMTRLQSSKRGMSLLPNASVVSSNNSIGLPGGGTFASFTNNKGTGRLTVRCIPSEIATILASVECEMDRDANIKDNDGKSATADIAPEEKILKDIYRDLKVWIRHQHQERKTMSPSSVSWIVLDEITTLSTLTGDKAVYCFIGSILSVIKQYNMNESIGLIFRCSNDHQQRIYESVRRNDIAGEVGGDVAARVAANASASAAVSVSATTPTSVDNITSIPMYAGAGGSYHCQAAQVSDWTRSPPWTVSQLEPFMDTIIDVMPLPSGFSRDAQGRIIISETPYGRGWGKSRVVSNSGITSFNKLRKNDGDISSGSSSSSVIVNYQLADSGPRAIRLRSK